MEAPQTHYAQLGADRIAYQISGEGSRDLVYTSGLWSHLDAPWEYPPWARFFTRLGAFTRLIRFDRRGSGLSDPRPDDGGSLVQHWIADLRAVLDACGSQQPVMLGTVDSGAPVLKFYEQHPQRCSGLIFAITTCCLARRDDYPQGHDAETIAQYRELLLKTWGHDELSAVFVPSMAHDPAMLRGYARVQRALAAPRAVADNIELTLAIDAREVLPKVQVPTLVLGRKEQKIFTEAQSRYIAEHITGARYVELPGGDLGLQWQDNEVPLAMIEEFVTGKKPSGRANRRLATVLFTDIVDSTKLAAKLGDAAWREKLDAHDRIVREQLSLHDGRLVDSAGDGTLATFKTPGEAINCAHALHEALKPIKLKIRAGLHIGEIELRDDGRVGGIAVHIGARVLGMAKAGDVLVSRTVRDVLIGSGYRFKERGIHELKGIPSKWPLYRVEPLED